ncbi:hypothetical protein KPH14_001575 [Odynerus spinipes]|uniref:Uncharacterized protein n=1 Tax=Odynerus spinipes TaxID=1348599 RepID=A0AAD9VVM4_9HYME|nr:hypothetical protein KPH14_001575 [Odynerus spinipes]
MQRNVLLLLSIANILYFPSCRSVHGQTSLNRPGFEDIDFKDRGRMKFEANGKDPYRSKEELRELLGKWTNNGEALEPKWRDGDAVPQFPFSHFAQTYSKDEEPELISNENVYDSIEYRRFDNRGHDYAESHQNGQLPLPRDTKVRPEDKRYAGINSRGKFEIKQQQMPIVRPQKEKVIKTDRIISNGYRNNVFQIRPNEYEHELADEEYLKPRPRKRRPPQNEEFGLNEKEVMMRNERVKVAAAIPSTRVPPPTLHSEAATSEKIETIKSLIKMQQEEGVSLSEILHRKNLTLIDLLTGKEDVISALKMENIDEIGDDIEQISMAMTSTLAKLPSTEKPSSTIENTIDTTTVGATIKIDLELPSKMKEITTTAMKSETSYKVSSPGISIEFDRDDGDTNQNLTRVIDEDEIMEFSDFTDYKKGRTIASPTWISLMPENNVAPSMRNINLNRPEDGSTLSIVKILSPTEITYKNENFEKHKQFDKIYSREESNSPSTIDDHLDLSEDDYQYDAPSKDMQQNDVSVSSSMRSNECKNHEDNEESVDVEKSKKRLNELVPKNTNDSFSEEMIKTFLKNYPNVEDAKPDNERYEDIVSEIEPEARAEILELFSSGSGKKLQRLLESRNMSLEELIALRQRGSSKVHLAEVSRLRNQKALQLPEDGQTSTKEQLQHSEEKSSLPQSGSETITTQNLINEMERNINDTTQFLESSTFVAITETSFRNIGDLNETREKDSNLLVEVAEVFKDAGADLNEAREKESNPLIEVTELFTTFKSLPFGKDYEEGILKNIDETSSKKDIVNESNIVQSGYSKEIVENDLTTNVNTVYDIIASDKKRYEDYNEDRDRSLSKIKSSIIASGVILGVTIVVFLAIFVTCRIRHKQKYRYRNSFPRTVFQSPMTTARKLSNTSSLNNIMVNVVATSTAKRSERNDSQQVNSEYDPKCDIDNDSLDANDSWETIPDYMK